MAMTLRMTETDTARLRSQAEAEGVSMQEIALSAVRQYLDRKTHRRMVDESLDDVMGRYATTLKRLGE